ncbi:hypothetical protein GF345_04455 [Candidatus Woesearchaeota archaeon]|nr:hypothetical protein [Candidatus Woesearchaeota archaeon]
MKRVSYIMLNVLLGVAAILFLAFSFVMSQIGKANPVKEFISSTLPLSSLQADWWIIAAVLLILVAVIRYFRSQSRCRTCGKRIRMFSKQCEDCRKGRIKHVQEPGMKTGISLIRPGIAFILITIISIAAYSVISYIMLTCSENFFCFFGSLWGAILLMVISIIAVAFWPGTAIDEKAQSIDDSHISKEESITKQETEAYIKSVKKGMNK